MDGLFDREELALIRATVRADKSADASDDAVRERSNKATDEPWFAKCHYIQLRHDSLDLKKTVDYFNAAEEEEEDFAKTFEARTREAKKIVENMQRFLSRFVSEEHEQMLERIVVRRYFEKVKFVRQGEKDKEARTEYRWGEGGLARGEHLRRQWEGQ